MKYCLCVERAFGRLQKSVDAVFVIYFAVYRIEPYSSSGDIRR